MTHKNIILLGATGSIGKSTLNLIRQDRERFNLIGISAYKQTEKLKIISDEFNVKYVCYFENDKDIKFNNKILHQSKLVKYFSKENISNKKIEKDLNNYLKKI